MYKLKREKAYKYIKKLIVEGRFSEKQAIDIHLLAKELEMSRTPIHKAITQLEQEGYLTVTPQVGVFVKRPNHQAVYDRLLVCATLDILMTGQAAVNMNDTQMKNLLKTVKNMDSDKLTASEYEELNMWFHTQIYIASGIEYAFSLNKVNWDYLNYVRMSDDIFLGKSRQQSQIEHWMIYYALKDRDVLLARSVMEKHLFRIVNSVNEKYKLSVGKSVK